MALFATIILQRKRKLDSSSITSESETSAYWTHFMLRNSLISTHFFNKAD